MAPKAKPKPRGDGESAAEIDPRELAFYSSLLAAWINTRMERDKSLFTLSSAGIGLLVTLLTTGAAHPAAHRSWYVVAFGFFLLALLTALAVFERNAHHIRQLADDPGARDRLLDWLDRLLVTWFVLGVAACVGLALSSF